jgi:hypothetical protein
VLEEACVTLVLALIGCTSPSETPPDAAPTAEDEAPGSSPFESCDPKQIDDLASKHGFQLVFEPCGSNSFLDFAWSTDGNRFYYRRGMTHRVVDAANKKRPEQNVPTSIPVGSVAWLSGTTLALPLGPASGITTGPSRIAVWDTVTQALDYFDLPADLSEPTDVMRGANPDEVVFSAVRSGPNPPERHAFEIDLKSREVTDKFPWLLPFDTLTYTAAGNAVVVGVGNTVTLYDAVSGKALGLWSPATRGVMHPGGRWLVLEHTGEPVSVFQPLGLEEMAPQDREAALARAEKQAAAQPPDFPRQVRPPMLSFVDTQTGKRYLTTAIQGSQFEWYEVQDFYGSFTTWGFEQAQFRRNVALGDFAHWMLGASNGLTEAWVHPASAGAPDAGTPPAPAPAAPPPAP